MKQAALVGAVLVMAAVGSALHLVSRTAVIPSAIPAPVECTFSHPQYAGTCVEQATPAANQTPVQACRVILNCLNDTRCVKTYCQATTIRAGWSLVSPKEKESSRTP